MAPGKRKASDGEVKEKQVEPQGDETLSLKRVTRSMTRQPGRAAKSSELTQPMKAKANAQAKKQSVGTVAKKEEAVLEDDGSHNKTVVVEHCKQCNSFKTRAIQVRDGLEKGVPGIRVLLNPEKPRRGCFEIREEGGKKFISLLDMKRPFKPMKDLDMEKVISDIIGEIKT